MPWYPFSRAAFVLPSPVERELVTRRMELLVVFWLGVVSGIGVASVLGGLPSWSGLVAIGLGILHWLWWIRRRTRGLERTRYEPPPVG